MIPIVVCISELTVMNFKNCMDCWLISWWQQFFIYFLKLIYNIKSFFVIFLYVFVIILSIHLTSSFNVLSFTFSSIPSVSPLLHTEYFLFSRVSFIWQFNHNSNVPHQLKIKALLESSHAVFILSALSKKKAVPFHVGIDRGDDKLNK